MKRKNIIIVIDLELSVIEIVPECYGNLKKACTQHGWVYNTIIKQKLPIVKDGWLIQRVPFN